MQGRFTQSAIKVLKLAQYEAKHLKHRHVGTEHILLGILDQADNLFYKAEVLANKGYSNTQLIKAIEAVVKRLETVATDTDSNLYTATQALKTKLEQFKNILLTTVTFAVLNNGTDFKLLQF